MDLQHPTKKYFTIKTVTLIFLAGLIIGLILGLFYEHGKLIKSLNLTYPIRNTETSYKFIRPLFTYNTPSADEQKEFQGIENKINDFITQKKQSKQLSSISLYFQALNIGKWIGIDEDTRYDSASLLKVAVLISYLKKAEGNSLLVTNKLIYTKDIDNLITFHQEPSKLEVGKAYTIGELLNRMIINSDNGAKNLLWENIDKVSLNVIFDVLGIQNYDTISPKNYSLFFRILYNGTYLDYDMSEKVLMLLSQEGFKNGIVAGLPQDIIVAHKFGSFAILNNRFVEGAELHDCGIIYYKPSPYFLCIMTKGSNSPALESVIKDISHLIYQEFSNYYK